MYFDIKLISFLIFSLLIFLALLIPILKKIQKANRKEQYKNLRKHRNKAKRERMFKLLESIKCNSKKEWFQTATLSKTHPVNEQFSMLRNSFRCA